MAKRKPKIGWVADFEANTFEQGDIYRWGLSKMYTQDIYKGFDIFSFMEMFKNRKLFETGTTNIVYFHNGSKYDFYFLLDFFLNMKHMFKQRITLDNKDTPVGSWSFFADDRKCIYEIAYKPKTRTIVKFWCSYRLINKPLKALGTKDEYKDSSLWDNNKMNIHWDEEKLLANPEELATLDKYLDLDVKVLRRVMEEVWSTATTYEASIKMTAGSTALNDWRKWLDEREKGFYHFKLENKMTTILENDKPTIIKYDDFKKFYKGGFTNFNPNYEWKHEKKDLFIYDVNSLYPSTMAREDVLFPYGEPFVATTNQLLDTWTYPVQFIDISWDRISIKKDKHPWISIKGGFDGGIYERSYGHETYSLTLNEYRQLLKDYNHKGLEIKKVYGFKAIKGSKLFGGWVNDRWGQVKEKGSKEKNVGMKEFAKLMLNSCYGKFGTNPYKWGYNVDLIKEPSTMKDEAIPYLPIACVITAEARLTTIRGMQANFKTWIYADTDSLHLLEPAQGIIVDEHKLGAWKFENKFDEWAYGGKKRYLHARDGILIEIKVAGMSSIFQYQVNFENFKEGMVFEMGRFSLNPPAFGELPIAKYGTFTLKSRKNFSLEDEKEMEEWDEEL